jgi:hypothetical protein
MYAEFGLHFICDEDEVVLATAEDHKGIVTPTRSLLRLEKTVGLTKPALMIIENTADVYAGNESNRALVTRFVPKHGGSGRSSWPTAGNRQGEDDRRSRRHWQGEVGRGLLPTTGLSGSKAA